MIRREPAAACAELPATVTSLFADQVRRAPDDVAVVSSSVRWSYRELDRRSSDLAQRLVVRGVRAEDRVGVLQHRTPELLVSLLAILKCGAAYVPVDLRAPALRRVELLNRAECVMTLTDQLVPEAVAGGLVHLPELQRAPDPPATTTIPPCTGPVSADQLAYVMYTSGSTGRPKGVAVTHAGVIDLARDRCWGMTRASRVLFHAPHAFDASTYEIWVPLLAGARVVVAPDGPVDARTLGRLVREYGVTHVHVTAGLFRVVADDDPGCFGEVKEVLTGGDVVSPAAVRALRQARPQVTVRHLYGPTEITLCATQHEVTPSDPHPATTLPIGSPLAHTRVHVLDEDLRSIDGVGELYLGGVGLARGYLGAPALTAERFVPDPYGSSGSRMYRTGDLGRRGPDGLLEFLGRADDQVKIRGFRVEPGEIEAVLARHPRVRQVAVVVQRDALRGNVLIAYVMPNPGDDGSGLAVALRDHVAARLPDYLVPSAIVLVARLPLTANGKLDRSLLPDLPAAPVGGRNSGSARLRNAEEHLLCTLFAEITGAVRVDVDDDFFALGGHSLLAARLVSRVAIETGVSLTIATVAAHPTPATLAAALAAHRNSSSDEPDVSS